MFPQDRRENWFHGQGLWADTPAGDWNNWVWQFKNRLSAERQFAERMTLTDAERAGFAQAGGRLAVAVTPHFFNLIDRADPACPIRRQVIPLGDEARVSAGECSDPVGEEGTTPVPGLVHRYPDRVLFLVTNQCAAYCRYCTRGRLVSDARAGVFQPRYEQALDYIAAHTEVRDVLLSGGDPLLLTDAKLDYLLGRLRAIPHVEFVRVGSRVPVFMPQRVTPALCEVFRRHGPVWLSLHVNHPRECTADLAAACERLAFAGVVLGNQSVLLRGVNDDAATLRSLVHRLLMMRVRPYYLYACDKITGTAHLRVPVRRGVELIRSLRGFTSGYAVPQFVIDAPGGGGKVPVNPDYIENWGEDGAGGGGSANKSTTAGTVILRNYQGRRFEY
jgi:lysine 2,3-aminomutase